MSWSAGLLPAPLNSAPGFKLLEQTVNTPLYLVGSTETGVVDASYPWAHPKRYGGAGDGRADDTIPCQTAINYGRRNGIKARWFGGFTYRITSGLGSQSDGVYQANDVDMESSTILVDFIGAPALTITGGAALQRIFVGTIQPTVSRQLASGGAYVAANVGVYVQNCRHDLRGVAQYFGGEGWLFESTAPNSNYSRHDVEAFQCGRGARITGANDNFAVVHSTIKAYGCSQEGIRVDAGTAMRDCDWDWESENNLLADTNNTAKNDIHILSASACTGWVYSEHSGGLAGELYLDPVGVTDSRVYSARRNKDTIFGSNVGVWGQIIYQTSDGLTTRYATPARFMSIAARKANAGEYVDAAWVAGDGVIGRVRGEALGMHLLSATATGKETGKALGVNDSYAYVGMERKYSGSVALTTGAPTTTITLPTLTAGASVVSGTINVVGSAPGGGFREYLASFYVEGVTLTINPPTTDRAAAPNPAVVTLAVSAGVLQLTLTYTPATWGATYTFLYDVTGLLLQTT